MRKFATTLTILTVGVLASKVIAGYSESPLHNRFVGELRVKDNAFGKPTGLTVTMELAKKGLSEEYFIVTIDGPEGMAHTLGLEPGRTVCHVPRQDSFHQEKRNRADTIQRVVYAEGAKTCRKFYLGIDFTGHTRTYFQAKGLTLEANLKRDNSRNFVGWIQKYNM